MTLKLRVVAVGVLLATASCSSEQDAALETLEHMFLSRQHAEEDRSVRDWVAAMLAGIGEAQALVDALGSDDVIVRRAGASAISLVEHAPSGAFEAIHRALERDRSEGQLYVPGLLKHARSEHADLLIRAMRGNDALDPGNATIAVSRLGLNDASAQAMARALSSPDRSTRSHALEVLAPKRWYAIGDRWGGLSGHRPRPTPWPEFWTRPQFAAAQQRAIPALRVVAVSAAEWGQNNNRAVARLAEVSDDCAELIASVALERHSDVAATALVTLAKRKQVSAKTLLRVLAGKHEWGVRNHVADALGVLGTDTKPVRDALVDLFQNGKTLRNAIASAVALAQLGHATDRTTAYLAHQPPEEKIARALRQTKGAFELLSRVATGNAKAPWWRDEPLCRHHATAAMRAFTNRRDEAIAALTALTTDPNVCVRISAADSLRELKGPRETYLSVYRGFAARGYAYSAIKFSELEPESKDAIPYLIRALQAGGGSDVLAALAKFGARASAAAPALAGYLKGRRSWRGLAAEILGDLGVRNAAVEGALYHDLNRTMDGSWRACAEALAKLGPLDLPRFLRTLARGSKTHRRAVRPVRHLSDKRAAVDALDEMLATSPAFAAPAILLIDPTHGPAQEALLARAKAGDADAQQWLTEISTTSDGITAYRIANLLADGLEPLDQRVARAKRVAETTPAIRQRLTRMLLQPTGKDMPARALRRVSGPMWALSFAAFAGVVVVGLHFALRAAAGQRGTSVLHLCGLAAPAVLYWRLVLASSSFSWSSIVANPPSVTTSLGLCGLASAAAMVIATKHRLGAPLVLLAATPLLHAVISGLAEVARAL